MVTHALTYAVIILFPLISLSFSPLPLKSSKTLLSVWEEHKQQIRHAAILDTHTHIPHTRLHIHFHCVCACYTLLNRPDHPNRLFIALCQQHKKGTYVKAHTGLLWKNILVWLSIISNICFQLHILSLTKTSNPILSIFKLRLQCFIKISYLKFACVYRNSRALKRNMSCVCRRLSIHTLSLLKRRTYRSERWVDKYAHIIIIYTYNTMMMKQLEKYENSVPKRCRNTWLSL